MRLVVIFLCIISCQSSNNETFTKTTSNTSFSSSTTAIPLPPHFLPLHANSNFGLNESYGSTSSSTSPNNNSPTARSRIIETKYGKVQGLSITLFPHLSTMGNQHHSSKSNPLKNKLVEVFLNIPYASPPVKSYRFSPTQTPIPWDGVRSAVKPGFVCPQMMPDIRNETAALKDMPKGYLEYLRRVEPYLRNQSEDCLYLNVYSPIGKPH
ncbi:unnamed protein product [Allacma fusca]|uniref:Carboxylesterase type B domain-containing protein n=1 Tax=Allacma fusca TaxID=39272 RepID=A0A8J2JJR9_9HEXA|nr:unnamed protein product [Allacma fusca]